MRKLVLAVMSISILVVVAAPAWACGGLVNPNGTVSLVRTATLAAYVGGVEHYVTAFEFAGGGAEFGSIVPLPGVPSKVERAGDWTLQRLVEEVQEPVLESGDTVGAVAQGASAPARVILETSIDALDITILEGGGDAVGRWAKDNGFELTPDAPEILDFYASRSPIFMAARFDPKAARDRDQQVGDGTPIHLTIPTPNPWVPLRILTLGLGKRAPVEADVFLLTENVPEMLPWPEPADADEGMVLERSEPASASLLADLRSDKGMKWLPRDDMWLSYLRIDTTAGKLTHDLAIDATGYGKPSPVAAGIVGGRFDLDLPEDPVVWWPWALAGALIAGAVVWVARPSGWAIR